MKFLDDVVFISLVVNVVVVVAVVHIENCYGCSCLAVAVTDVTATDLIAAGVGVGCGNSTCSSRKRRSDGLMNVMQTAVVVAAAESRCTSGIL